VVQGQLKGCKGPVDPPAKPVAPPAPAVTSETP
jgi:hypothetical protein